MVKKFERDILIDQIFFGEMIVIIAVMPHITKLSHYFLINNMHTIRLNYIRHLRWSYRNYIDSIISSNAKNNREYSMYCWLENKKAESTINRFEREYIQKGNFWLEFPK